jgi:hypothetical protein
MTAMGVGVGVFLPTLSTWEVFIRSMKGKGCDILTGRDTYCPRDCNIVRRFSSENPAFGFGVVFMDISVGGLGLGG